MRWHRPFAGLALVIIVGCSMPSPPPSPSPSPATSAQPTGQQAWQVHQMPNLGYSVALPPSWRSVLELSDDEIRHMPDTATVQRSSILDMRSHRSRLDPGGDFGLVAIDPSVDAVFAAQWAPDSSGGLDFESRVDQAVNALRASGNLAPGLVRAETMVAGHRAVTLRGSRQSYGLVISDAVTTLMLTPSNDIIQFGLASGPDRLDASFATAVLDTLTALPDPPAGKPIRSDRDGQIDRYLAKMGPAWWGFSGDAEALAAYGMLDRIPIFARALAVVPEFHADRDSFRGGFIEPMASDQATTIGIDVIRSTGAGPTWDALLSELRSSGMAESHVSGCDLYRNARDGDAARIAGISNGLFVYIRGDTDALVSAAADHLGLCP